MNKKNKPDEWIITVHIDQEKLWESKPTDGKTNKFSDPPVFYKIKEDANQLRIGLHEKNLIGHSFKGELRFAMDDLLEGYPMEQWFDLKNKEGKKEKESKDGKKAQLYIRLLYLAKEDAPTHEEFKHPLHYLIKKNRLDIFQRKIDDLEKQVDGKDEKSGLTPLLLAASEGKVAFVKVLLDNGASVADERDKEGRTALHLAALNGYTDVVNLLGRQKSAFPVRLGLR